MECDFFLSFYNFVPLSNLSRVGIFMTPLQIWVRAEGNVGVSACQLIKSRHNYLEVRELQSQVILIYLFHHHSSLFQYSNLYLSEYPYPHTGLHPTHNDIRSSHVITILNVSMMTASPAGLFINWPLNWQFSDPLGCLSHRD